MRYGHVINFFNNSPSWAILPDKLFAIIEFIELRANGLSLTESEIEARIGPKEPKAVSIAPTSVAVLSMHGTISHRASMLKRASGGMSVEDFQHDFRAAVRNPEIGAIVLDIDSPGGSTSGIEELANEIFAARGEKRIVAAVNSMAASAAYWLASSAHEIAVTPSGHVGSIGVLGTHMDYSEQAKKQGVSTTIVSAGKYKAEASDMSPLSGEARMHLQSLVDDRYEAFVKAVARGRGVTPKTVRDGYGEGRVVTAKAGLSMGMADSIETIDQVISRTAGRAVKARRVAEASAWDVAMSAETEFEPQAMLFPKDTDPFAWAKANGYGDLTYAPETAEGWLLELRDSGDFESLCRATLPSAPTAVAIGGKLRAGLKPREVAKPVAAAPPAPEPTPEPEPVVYSPERDPARVALELMQLA